MAISIQGDRIGPAQDPTLEVGGDGAHVLGCPGCGRPLARGARRCQDCGMRFVAGTPVSRASAFVAAGLVAGLVLGGAGIALVDRVGGSTAAGATPTTASTSGTTPSAAPTTAPTAPPTANPVPALVASAIDQSGDVDAKLVEHAWALDAALRAERFDATEVASILRLIAADMAFGGVLATRASAWEEARDASQTLGTLYADVQATARVGLRASARNSNAYVGAGLEMIRLLNERLPAAHVELQAVARAAGETVPDLGLLPAVPVIEGFVPQEPD